MSFNQCVSIKFNWDTKHLRNALLFDVKKHLNKDVTVLNYIGATIKIVEVIFCKFVHPTHPHLVRGFIKA
jgi:hypothetical protein